MNQTLNTTMYMLSSLAQSARFKSSRNSSDVLADQIVKAANKSSVLSMIEAFAENMNADIEYVPAALTAEFLHVINSSEAPGVLYWLRKNAVVAAMLLSLRKRSKKDVGDTAFLDALETITDILPTFDMGISMPGRVPEIPLTIQTLSPLSHGADRKAGNSTLFRREEVLSTTGKTLSLPKYGANAIRGIMRRVLADDFTTRIGLSTSRSDPPYSDWFLAALYNGGKLEENSAEAKALSKELGSSGTMRIQGIHQFRDMVLPLSVMGVSLGNRVLCRHGFDNYSAEPRCVEWGNGDISEAELFTWEYLTRKDDLEIRPVDSTVKSGQMIANTECIKRGVILDCGIDILPMIQPLERACVGMAIDLLTDRGKLGANNRYGQGFVTIECAKEWPDSSPYKHYIETHKTEILDYLQKIGAVKHESTQLNLTSAA